MQSLTKHSKLILAVICAVLLLALIVVSAFAYQWHGENKDLRKKNHTLKAITDQSTIDSLTSELTDLNMKVAEYEAIIQDRDNTIKEYKAILEENGLLPE